MIGLTVGDDPEWEGIKKNFVNGGALLKSRITAIQRLAKEHAVGMEDAEAIVARWDGECRDESLKSCEKFTISGVFNERSRCRKR
jgi:hypothetical protein